MLSYYLQYFDTVELNNSFYKLPERSTFCSWCAAVPGNFRFAVKASRFITHNKKLKDPEDALERFFSRAEALGPNLGPILFQLPPRWKLNLERLEHFLIALPRQHRYAFEFRDLSWNTQEVYALLRSYNAAYCIYELSGYRSPVMVTADWTYVRLHGPGGKYQGSYDRQALNGWATQVVKWSRSLKAIYVYFDNDDSAYAPHNALELKQLIHRSVSRKRPIKAA